MNISFLHTTTREIKERVISRFGTKKRFYPLDTALDREFFVMDTGVLRPLDELRGGASIAQIAADWGADAREQVEMASGDVDDLVNTLQAHDGQWMVPEQIAREFHKYVSYVKEVTARVGRSYLPPEMFSFVHQLCNLEQEVQRHTQTVPPTGSLWCAVRWVDELLSKRKFMTPSGKIYGGGESDMSLIVGAAHASRDQQSHHAGILSNDSDVTLLLEATALLIYGLTHDERAPEIVLGGCVGEYMREEDGRVASTFSMNRYTDKKTREWFETESSRLVGQAPKMLIHAMNDLLDREYNPNHSLMQRILNSEGGVLVS